MNSSRTDHKKLRTALLTVFVLLVPTVEQGQQASSQANRELEMTVCIDGSAASQSKAPKFRVELRNVSDHDLILNLGYMLANGRNQYADAIVLTLTDPQGRKGELRSLREPWFIAGRVDPFIVPLPVGSTFSIFVDLDNYRVDEFDYRSERGAYLLEARFSGRAVTQQEANLDVKGIALMPYWTRSITSNRLQFEVNK